MPSRPLLISRRALERFARRYPKSAADMGIAGDRAVLVWRESDGSTVTFEAEAVDPASFALPLPLRSRVSSGRTAPDDRADLADQAAHWVELLAALCACGRWPDWCDCCPDCRVAGGPPEPACARCRGRGYLEGPEPGAAYPFLPPVLKKRRTAPKPERPAAKGAKARRKKKSR